MKSWFVFAAVAVAIPVAAAAALDKDTPTIEAVMQKLHKGKAKSQFAVLKAQADAKPPAWEAIQKSTKDFVILGAALEKNDPPKGEKASWKKLADKYFQDSKAMDDAATAKDLTAFQAAHKTLGGSCMACHNAHRGK